MGDFIVEPFEPSDLQDAAHVVSKAMCTNPTHVAVFQGQGEEKIRRQEAMFKIQFQYNLGNTFASFCVCDETRTEPGSAIPCIREARFVVSPTAV
jgi:hypothetical protein